MTLSVPAPDTDVAPHRPHRRCIVSGESLPTEALMRFVVAPDGAIVPDLRAALEGRGIWIGAERGMIETAVRKKLFQRAARQAVKVPEDLAATVERLLVESLSGLLSMARKAGNAVAGAEKTAIAVKNGSCALLFLARDAAPNAQGRIPVAGIQTVACLTADELGAVFGRERTVHAAVLKGGFAPRFEIESRRLTDFRGKPDGEVRHDAKI
jgi:predicted RNA-binding protein YlxR (DUF448 family)